MVMEDTLKHEGSDTRCVFPSGEKCPYQIGGSQRDAVNCMSLKWCISSLGRGMRALGDHTVKTHGFQWRMHGIVMEAGTSGLSEIRSSLLSLALASHLVVIFRTLLVLICFFLNLFSKKAVSLFTPSCMMVCLNAGLQTLPPIWCQCVKCQHGRVHWLASHQNMPSSCVMVSAAPPCEGKHIKHTHAHNLCMAWVKSHVCTRESYLINTAGTFGPLSTLVAELMLMKKQV